MPGWWCLHFHEFNSTIESRADQANLLLLSELAVVTDYQYAIT